MFSCFRNHQTVFHRSKSYIFSTTSPTWFSVFLDYSHPSKCEVISTVVLLCISLKSLFWYLLTCLLAICIWRNVCLNLCPFFLNWVIFLLLSYKSSLYSLNISSLSDIYFTSIFSLNMGNLFTFLMFWFAAPAVLVMVARFIYFFFCFSCFWCHS